MLINYLRTFAPPSDDSGWHLLCLSHWMTVRRKNMLQSVNKLCSFDFVHKVTGVTDCSTSVTQETLSDDTVDVNV